jgi:prepilin-type processing-associated H-X9-DG protein
MANDPVTPRVVINWPALLYPYTRSVKIYSCPSSTAPIKEPIWPQWENSYLKLINMPYPHEVSYIPNYEVLSPWNYLPQRLAVLDHPSETVTLVEMTDLWAARGWTGQGGISYDSSVQTSADLEAQLAAKRQHDAKAKMSEFVVRTEFERHNGGSVYVFADGHARWARANAILDPDHNGRFDDQYNMRRGAPLQPRA